MIRKMYVENRGGFFFLHRKKPSYKSHRWQSRDSFGIDDAITLALCGTKRDIPRPGDVLVIEYYWTRELTAGRTKRTAVSPP